MHDLAADAQFADFLNLQLSVRSSRSIRSRPRVTNSSAQDGTDFMGERLTVQFARGSRQREGREGGGGGGGAGYGAHERPPPRPRRTPHRMQITGLPSDTSWQ